MDTPTQATDLGELTFDEFRKRFSTGESVNGQPITTNKPVYLVPNEAPISRGFEAVDDLLDRITSVSPDPKLNFYGIIGGVDLTLSYIAEIWSRLGRLPVDGEAIVLTDINHTALDYLRYRLNIFRGASNLQQYLEILEIEEPKIAIKMKEYSEKLSPEDREKLWFNDESRFRLLKNMVEAGSIKAFQSDYYGKGQDVIVNSAERTSPNGAVLYLSDIAGVSPLRSPAAKHKGNDRIVPALQKRQIPFVIIENGMSGNYKSISSLPRVSYAQN